MNKIILPEIIWIGIYDSRLATKNIEITKNRKTSLFEIELPMEQGGISYIDNDKSRITSNTVICAKPGQIRHTKLPFKCYFIHISITKGELYDILMSAPNYYVTKKTNEYKKIFNEMFEYYSSGLEIDNIILYSLILKLIYTIQSDCQHLCFGKNIKNNNYELIEKAMNFINLNLDQSLTLNDIAKHVSLSPIHFHNTFKAATGKTPHQHLTEMRIKKAIKLLVSTEMKLSQIAYECGFSSQAYFNYAFKKYMNVTPREYMHKMFEKYQNPII